jgi:amidase
MSKSHPTRREVLLGFAGVPLLQGAPGTKSADSSFCFMSAVEMARLIHAKKLSAREALAMHLKQIERVNPKVNAIVTLAADLAAAAAAKADEMQARGEPLGPLHGLPVAHKDLLETRGIRTTFGSVLYKDYVPTEDDLVVERIRNAGGITIGKTNTPEFGAETNRANRIFRIVPPVLYGRGP